MHGQETGAAPLGLLKFLTRPKIPYQGFAPMGLLWFGIEGIGKCHRHTTSVDPSAHHPGKPITVKKKI